MKNTKEIGLTQQVETDPAISDEVASTQKTIADLRQLAEQRFGTLLTAGADTTGVAIEITLPDALPPTMPMPLHFIGDRVLYQGLSSHESGVVVGMEYAPAQHRQGWQWRYQIYLDSSSPSKAWISLETAWEDDVVSAGSQSETPAPTRSPAETETP